MRDAHERADRVRDHKEHEHGHRLLYSIGGKNASSQMVIGNDNASRRGGHRLFHRGDNRLEDDAHPVKFHAACGRSRRAANRRNQRERKEGARREHRRELIGCDILEPSGRECRHHHEQAAANYRGQVGEQGARRKRRCDDNRHHEQPDEHRANLDIAEEGLQAPLPHLGMDDETDRAQDHEQHEEYLDGNRVVVGDAFSHRCEAAGVERGDCQPDRLQHSADRLHADRDAQRGEHHRGDEDDDERDAQNELRRLDDVGNHVLASALGGIERRPRTLAENAKRERDDDESQAADQVHHEAEHVVGVGEVVDVERDGGTCRRETRDAVEKRIHVGGVVPGQEKRDRCEEREHDPREARDRKRLATAQATRLDAQKLQQRADDKRDTDAQQVALGGLPFLEHERR